MTPDELLEFSMTAVSAALDASGESAAGRRIAVVVVDATVDPSEGVAIRHGVIGALGDPKAEAELAAQVFAGCADACRENAHLATRSGPSRFRQ